MLVLPMYVVLGAPSVALPAIGRALAVPFGATAWILAGWSLTSALAMPVAGRLLVRWSPFQVLVSGVVTLTAGSALAGGGPAAVAGLSGIVPVPVALSVLAALPLAGLVLSLTRRPAADRCPRPDATRGSPR